MAAGYRVARVIDHWAAGIAEREQPRYFVVSFAGRIVARAAQACVGKMRGADFAIRI